LEGFEIPMVGIDQLDLFYGGNSYIIFIWHNIKYVWWEQCVLCLRKLVLLTPKWIMHARMEETRSQGWPISRRLDEVKVKEGSATAELEKWN